MSVCFACLLPDTSLRSLDSLRETIHTETLEFQLYVHIIHEHAALLYAAYTAQRGDLKRVQKLNKKKSRNKKYIDKSSIYPQCLYL